METKLVKSELEKQNNKFLETNNNRNKKIIFNISIGLVMVGLWFGMVYFGYIYAKAYFGSLTVE